MTSSKGNQKANQNFDRPQFKKKYKYKGKLCDLHSFIDRTSVNRSERNYNVWHHVSTTVNPNVCPIYKHYNK